MLKFFIQILKRSILITSIAGLSALYIPGTMMGTFIAPATAFHGEVFCGDHPNHPHCDNNNGGGATGTAFHVEMVKGTGAGNWVAARDCIGVVANNIGDLAASFPECPQVTVSVPVSLDGIFSGTLTLFAVNIQNKMNRTCVTLWFHDNGQRGNENTYETDCLAGIISPIGDGSGDFEITTGGDDPLGSDLTLKKTHQPLKGVLVGETQGIAVGGIYYEAAE